MTPLRIATACAIGAVVAWGLKAVAIAVAGGLDRSPFEGPLFLLGLALLLAAFVGAGLAATTGRGTPVRVLGALGAVLGGLAVSLLVETGVGALVPDSAGWVQEEAGLWAISALTAVAFATWYAHSRRARARSG